MLLVMVEKTLDHHILPKLKIATIVSIRFDLWMYCGGVDTFALIIIFLNEI